MRFQQLWTNLTDERAEQHVRDLLDQGYYKMGCVWDQTQKDRTLIPTRALKEKKDCNRQIG